MESLKIILICFCTIRINSEEIEPDVWNYDNFQKDYQPDDEILLISQDSHPHYQFNAFGENVKLLLKPNYGLVTPEFKAFIVDDKLREEMPPLMENCHYLHADDYSSAAVNLCHPNQFHGLILLKDFAFEILPLQSVQKRGDISGKVPHLVKKRPIIPKNWTEELRGVPFDILKGINLSLNSQKIQKKDKVSTPMVEVALFFDEAGYNLFGPYFKNNDENLRDMLLAYVNGVQALYHHPSAGIKIDIAITKLEIFKKQPIDLPHYSGERGNLLDSFCAYNEKHNPVEDKDPKHWDMGLDFYAVENGKRSGVTMGLATVGGVCQPKYACVIAEFGVTNLLGKPYPSAGFTSVYVLAHEMGHNLGMHHDSYTNSCPKDGFIMSPSRGVIGETIWSYCSADVLKKLSEWAKCLYDKQKRSSKFDHTKFGDAPGAIWGAKKQCQILLRDPDAVVQDSSNKGDMCQSLQCRTPHRTGYYFAGPALEGTKCGEGKRCQGGDCVPAKAIQFQEQQGQWSEWIKEPCDSGCLKNSRGYQKRRRTCDYPFNNDGCDGLSYSVTLCNDEKICGKYKRRSVSHYASSKCREFSRYLPELASDSYGLQAPYEHERLWVSCAIFCRRQDTGYYYTPRLDLNNLGVDPYFPDGTWCNNDGRHNYYCLQHHCLPENFKLTKDYAWKEDYLLPQNAKPFLLPLPQDVVNYLSLDHNGKPLLTTLPPISTEIPSEDEWDIKDYIEIPN